MKRKVLALLLAVTMFAGMSVTAFAADGATVSFTSSNTLEYSGVTKDGDTVNLGDAFENVAPGETRTQTITLRNDNKRTADFYMSAEAVKALEAGKEAAKGAGYDIKLTAGDTVLYDSTVGGYKSEDGDSASSKGIDEMNGALEDYILIATMQKGESTDVVLTIVFDGEAMDNNAEVVDYSLTDGQLAFDFKVGYEDPSGEVIIKEVSEDGQVTYVKKIVNIIENAVPLGAVATGDGAMVGAAAVVLLVGASMIIFGRKKKEEE